MMSIDGKCVYGNYLEFTAPGVGYNKYGKVYNVWTEGTITNNLAFINSKSRCGLVVGFTSSDSEVEDCYYDYAFDGSRSQADTIKNPKGTCASNMSIDDLADVYGKAFSQSDFNSACNPENEMNGLKASTYTGYALMQIVYDNNGTEEILDMFPIFEVPGSGYDNIYLSKSLNDFYYSDTFIGENGNVYATNNTQRIFLPTDGSVVKLYAKDKKEKIEPYYDGDPVMLPTTTESTRDLSSGENFVKWRTCLSKEPTTGPDTSGLIAVNRLYGTGTHNGDNATYSWYAEGTKPNGMFYEGDDIFLRFRIGSGVEANDGTIKTGGYNIYKSWANATYRIGKTVLTEGNALNYFTFDAPTGQKYMTNHSLYEYPTVAARTDAIVTPPADFTLSYETESGAAVTGNPVDAGTYNVLISFEGNDNFEEAQNVKIGTFTIGKNDIFRNEYGTEGYKYGDTISFCAVIEGPKGKTVAGNWECDPISEGTVQLKINGVPVGDPVTPDNKGDVKISVSSIAQHLLPEVKFTWELVFSGTDNYNPYTFKSTKTLKKQDAAITVTPYGDDVITYGDEPYVRFRVSAPYDLSDIINGLKVYDYKSDKTTKYSEDELMFDVEEGTGAFIYRLDNPVAGEHYIIFEYAGNDIYAAENVEQKLTVNKRPVTVSVTNTEFAYGDDVKLNLKLGGNVYGETSNVDIEVTLEKPGKRITYNKDNISLPGTYNVDFLSGGTEKIPAGEYTVTVKVTHTDENSNYLNFNETLTGTTVTVNKAQPK